MDNSGFTAIGSTATGPQYSRWTPSRVLLSLLMLALFLSFGARRARAQCGSLSAPSTTWQNGGNSFWNIDGNWTSGTPTASTNACILNGTSTVTLNTTGNANALQLASGNNLAITGAGSLTLLGASVSTGGIENNGTFNNKGTINDQLFFVNLGGIANSGMFNNSGTVNTTLTNNGLVMNSGTINEGGVFTPAGGGDLTNNGIIGNTGVIFIDEELSLNNYGVINNSNEILTGPFTRAFNFGILNNTGMLILLQPENSLSNSGIFNNSGTVSNPGVFFNSGTLNNSGTFTSFSTSFLGNFRNSGLLNDAGTFNTGTFVNSGAVVISSAGLLTMTANGPQSPFNNYIQMAGATFVNGTLNAAAGAIVDIQGGILGGTGTINGDVLMNGVMSPGSNGVPGALTINGNYEQGATGLFEELISGSNSNGVLDVSGVLSLDPGSLLEITLQGGFDPLGDSFTILSFGSLVGEFSNPSIFFADGFEWTVTYGPNDAVLTAVGVPEPNAMPLIAIGFLALIGSAAKKTAEL
jgi:hypothetical protein